MNNTSKPSVCQPVLRRWEKGHRRPNSHLAGPPVLSSRGRLAAGLLGAVAMLLACGPASLRAQSGDANFAINGVRTDPTGRFEVRFDSESQYYFVLYRGSTLTGISNAVAAALGTDGFGTLQDPWLSRTNAAGFYRVLRASVDSPFDIDQDGIDDVWELRYRRAPGAALNGLDANQDLNGNGTNDLTEYVATQPARAWLQTPNITTIAANGKMVDVKVSFSKPFQGRVGVQVGGTAQPDLDYTMTGLTVGDMSAQLDVNGTEGLFRIQLRDAPAIGLDRFLVLSLLEPSTNVSPTYRVITNSTARIRVTESDAGLYSGTLTFTNNAALGSHPVKLAFRRNSLGSFNAYLDLIESPLFRAVSPAVQPLPTLNSWIPNRPFAGVLNASALGRSLNWTLSFTSGTVEGRTLMARAELRMTAPSASDRPLTVPGQLLLHRID